MSCGIMETLLRIVHWKSLDNSQVSPRGIQNTAEFSCDLSFDRVVIVGRSIVLNLCN